MLKWLMLKRLAAFERTYAYDASYVRAILATDLRAFLALAKVGGIARYRRDVPLDVYYAAKLTSTMAEDCGPCTQLVVAMGLRAGVAPRTLAAVLRQDSGELSEPAELGVSFARAALRHSEEGESLRAAIVQRWGERALISLAFAVAAGRLYPTLKYALGDGVACERVVVGGESISVLRSAA